MTFVDFLILFLFFFSEFQKIFVLRNCLRLFSMFIVVKQVRQNRNKNAILSNCDGKNEIASIAFTWNSCIIFLQRFTHHWWKMENFAGPQDQQYIRLLTGPCSSKDLFPLNALLQLITTYWFFGIFRPIMHVKPD